MRIPKDMDPADELWEPESDILPTTCRSAPAQKMPPGHCVSGKSHVPAPQGNGVPQARSNETELDAKKMHAEPLPEELAEPSPPRQSPLKKVSMHKALMLSMKCLKGISKTMEASDQCGFRRNLLDMTNGSTDLFDWMYFAEKPKELRKVLKGILAGQVVEESVMSQLVTERVMGALDGNPRTLERLVNLKLRCNARITATVETIARLSSLTVPCGPGVQVTVANSAMQQNINRDGKQEAPTKLNQNRDEEEAFDVPVELL